MRKRTAKTSPVKKKEKKDRWMRRRRRRRSSKMRRVRKHALYFLIFCFISTGIYYPTFIFQLLNPFISTKNPQKFHRLIRELKTNPFNENQYPWLHISLNHLRQTFEKNLDGIVICTSNQHIHLTLVTLHSLKILFNNNNQTNFFPIELTFASQKDLNQQNQQLFQREFPHIILRDLSQIFNTQILQLQGWQIKPFAMLAAQFTRVLLLDADVFFLQKPSILFSIFNQKNISAIFFVDRVNLTLTTRQWIREEFNLTINTFQNRSQESGVVLIDKSSDAGLRGLMAVCKLNEKYLRENYFYQYLYGDKDTFWLGFSLVNVNYLFISSLTAVIGRRCNKKYVCGHMLHLDQFNKPLWWNGGFHLNRYLNIFLTVDGWINEGKWIWTRKQACILNGNRTMEIFSLNQSRFIENYFQLTQQIFPRLNWFSWKKWVGILLT